MAFFSIDLDQCQLVLSKSWYLQTWFWSLNSPAISPSSSSSSSCSCSFFSLSSMVSCSSLHSTPSILQFLLPAPFFHSTPILFLLLLSPFYSFPSTPSPLAPPSTMLPSFSCFCCCSCCSLPIWSLAKSSLLQPFEHPHLPAATSSLLLRLE